MKKILLLILIISAVSCARQNNAEKFAKTILSDLENGNYTAFKEVSPIYSSLTEDELNILSENLSVFMDNSTIETKQGQANQIIISVQTEDEKQFLLQFTVAETHKGDFQIIEGFSISRNIDFILSEN